MLGAEVDANVEVPAACCNPQEPLLDAGQRLPLPGVVETEVGEAWRPSNTLEGKGVSALADRRGPDERCGCVELFQAVEEAERDERVGVRFRRDGEELRRQMLRSTRRASRDGEPSGVAVDASGGSVLAR
jgi:hypothetical protein